MVYHVEDLYLPFFSMPIHSRGVANLVPRLSSGVALVFTAVLFSQSSFSVDEIPWLNIIILNKIINT
jgi:hypothetical protein